jgi:hypothetical protein
MPTGRDAQTPDDRPQVIVFSLVSHWFHGPQRDNQPCPGPVRKQNTGLLQMLLLSAVGYETCFKNSMFMLGRPLSYIVTTYQLYTYHRTQFIIDERNMSNWTFTLSEKG